MELHRNNEIDNEFCDLCTGDDNNENDFDFDYGELVINLDELELSDEDLDIDTGELGSMNEIYTKSAGLISIYLEEQIPISVFRTLFFNEEI